MIIAEDDEGHALLISKNLSRSGITNEMLHFRDGQEVLDFLYRTGPGPCRKSGVPYLMLLDVRMPKIDGVEVLRLMKQHPELCKIPVIMMTTTDDPREVEKCHHLGCGSYIVKPVNYDNFVDTIRRLGLFLLVAEVPRINGGM